jgi:hypothetical protein
LGGDAELLDEDLGLVVVLLVLDAGGLVGQGALGCYLAGMHGLTPVL